MLAGEFYFLMSSESFALLLALPTPFPLHPPAAAANNDNVVTSSPETDLFLAVTRII